MVLHYAVGKRVGKDIQSKRRGYHILFVFFGCLVALAALFSMWSNLLVPNKQPVEPSFVTNATQKRSDAAKYHSTSPYNLTEPYWFMTSNDSCPLYHMGLILGDDKFTSHSYHNMYCEVFRDFKATQKKIRMLEIGFGCGHNNHGVSARIWKSFFSNGGSDVNLYEIDLDTPMHKNCSKNFLLEHPNIVSKLYLGDQADKPFLRRVVNDSGGLYDIMLDDGGHGDWHQRPTFAVMWDHVMPGGLYVIEDLQVSASKLWMIRDILSWADMLASTRYPSHPNWRNNSIDWVKWPWSDMPKGMISVHVQAEIAIFRKKYPTQTTVPTSTIVSSSQSTNNYWNINQCELIAIDKKLHLHKFDNAVHPSSSYGNLYCETMRDFRRHRENRMPQMLLVGLNCNDRNNRSPENIAKLWKTYFTDNHGPGVHMFGMDNIHNTSKKCLNKFEPLMTGLYTRNLWNESLSKNSFVQDIYKGQRLEKYDVIIDDGKYSPENHYMDQKRSFLSLWPQLQLGGLYFVENMKASSSKKGFLRDVLGWMDHLLSPSQHRSLDNATWTVWHPELNCTQHKGLHSLSDRCTTRPVDMLSIHCQADICVFRKVYTMRGVKCLVFNDCRIL